MDDFDTRPAMEASLILAGIGRALGFLALAWGVHLDAPAGDPTPGATVAPVVTSLQAERADPARTDHRRRGPLTATEVSR